MAELLLFYMLATQQENTRPRPPQSPARRQNLHIITERNTLSIRQIQQMHHIIKNNCKTSYDALYYRQIYNANQPAKNFHFNETAKVVAYNSHTYYHEKIRAVDILDVEGDIDVCGISFTDITLNDMNRLYKGVRCSLCNEIFCNHSEEEKQEAIKNNVVVNKSYELDADDLQRHLKLSTRSKCHRACC